jgi:hypothetical protein
MQEIEGGQKRLFRHHIEQNMQRRNTGNLFQLRANRWRLSTFDKPKFFNQLRLKGPLLFTFGFILTFGRQSMTHRVVVPDQVARTLTILIYDNNWLNNLRSVYYRSIGRLQLKRRACRPRSACPAASYDMLAFIVIISMSFWLNSLICPS